MKSDELSSKNEDLTRWDTVRSSFRFPNTAKQVWFDIKIWDALLKDHLNSDFLKILEEDERDSLYEMIYSLLKL